MELRGLDSNLPGTILTAVELVLAAAERVRREGLTVTPDDRVSTFEVADGRLLVPGFARLGGELLRASVAGATDDPAATAYLDSVVEFAGAQDGRLEELRRLRLRSGRYPTTEADVLGLYAPKDGRVSEAGGSRLVLWACDELEAQVSRLDRLREAEGEPAGASWGCQATGVG